MRSTKILFILGLIGSLLVFTPHTFAYNEWAGTRSAQFLKIPITAREAAMGEASCAAVDDVNSIYWNPAGLARVAERQFTLSHLVWLASIHYSNLAYAQPLSNLGVFGASASYLFMDPLIGRDASGDRIANFNAYDLLINLSYGRKLSEWASIGVNLKMIQEGIESRVATTGAVDLGILYKSEEINELTFGVLFKNIGFAQRFISEAYPLPYSTRMGILYTSNSTFRVAVDVDIPPDHMLSLHLGVEYWVMDLMAIRIGYKTNTIADLGALSGLTCGLGLKWDTWSADYAFVPYGDLGYTHRISLLAKF